MAVLLVLSIAAGAWLASRRAASRARPVPAREAAFAEPVLARRPLARAPAPQAGWRDALRAAPRPLDDSEFDEPPERDGAVFGRIHAPLVHPDVRLRALGQPEGSYLFNAGSGWLRFDGKGWIGVGEHEVPPGIAKRLTRERVVVAR